VTAFPAGFIPLFENHLTNEKRFLSAQSILNHLGPNSTCLSSIYPGLKAIAARRESAPKVRYLQEYHASIGWH
jgi:hypothetical protein